MKFKEYLKTIYARDKLENEDEIRLNPIIKEGKLMPKSEREDENKGEMQGNGQVRYPKIVDSPDQSLESRYQNERGIPRSKHRLS